MVEGGNSAGDSAMWTCSAAGSMLRVEFLCCLVHLLCLDLCTRPLWQHRSFGEPPGLFQRLLRLLQRSLESLLQGAVGIFEIALQLRQGFRCLRGGKLGEFGDSLSLVLQTSFPLWKDSRLLLDFLSRLRVGL
uniref:Uncharacterized protein n=1 Tax=Coccolithus braarudii TaxID=221442 RepID=A0A7S0Q0F9_9EUKA